MLLGQIWISKSNPIWSRWVYQKTTVVQTQNSVLVLDMAPVSNFVAEFISCACGLNITRGWSVLSVQALRDWAGKMGSSMSSVLPANLHHVHQFPPATRNKTLLWTILILLSRSLIERELKFKSSSMVTHLMEKTCQLYVCWFLLIWELSLL